MDTRGHVAGMFGGNTIDGSVQHGVVSAATCAVSCSLCRKSGVAGVPGYQLYVVDVNLCRARQFYTMLTVHCPSSHPLHECCVCVVFKATKLVSAHYKACMRCAGCSAQRLRGCEPCVVSAVEHQRACTDHTSCPERKVCDSTPCSVCTFRSPAGSAACAGWLWVVAVPGLLQYQGRPVHSVHFVLIQRVAQG